MYLFDWDEGNWPKCTKHGLTKDEIKFFFHNTPMIKPDRTPQNDETRYNAVGKNKERRYIFAVFTVREKDGFPLIRPISARYMHRKEIEHYEQR